MTIVEWGIVVFVGAAILFGVIMDAKAGRR